MIKNKANLLDADKINKTLVRLSHEIVEKNPNLKDLAIIGIRTRGDIIAKRLFSIIKDISQKKINIGTLDVTFYRDDFRTNLGSPKIGPSKILFDIDKKNIILIDDVLYTGRTIRAAMEEIFSLGRPNKIQLGVLIDRGHRQLPIKADYVGKNYPTSINEHIHVRNHSGVFDVSHMGPCFLSLADGIGGGDDAHAEIAARMCSLSPHTVAGASIAGDPGELPAENLELFAMNQVDGLEDAWAWLADAPARNAYPAEFSVQLTERQFGRVFWVRYLLRARADVDAAAAREPCKGELAGRTPLQLAVLCGHHAVVE